MIETFYIGGSPCSGKSTVVDLLSKKYNLYYFKIDDFLNKYTELGVIKNYDICRKQYEMSPEQTWMRDPLLQCHEELKFYEEIFGFIIDDLEQIIDSKAIITEGAAYLPNLIGKLNISKNRYISITPTKKFQVSQYEKREWISYALEGCNNKEKAFANWMERDAMFAEEVNLLCNEKGYMNIINDGKMLLDELAKKVSNHFGLEELYG
jgi:hypothetical protein